MTFKFSKAVGRLCLLPAAIFGLLGHAMAQQPAPYSASHSGKNEFVLKNATLLTTTHGRIEHGSVYVKDGKIVAFGANVSAPVSATVIDVDGKYVTPGIIDPHSHMALDGDVNEATSPVVPQMMMKDAFDYNPVLDHLPGVHRAGRWRHGLAPAAWLSRHDRRPGRCHQEQVRPRP